MVAITFINLVLQVSALLCIHLIFKKFAQLYDRENMYHSSEFEKSVETVRILENLKEGVMIFDKTTHNLAYSNRAIKQFEQEGSISVNVSTGCESWLDLK